MKWLTVTLFLVGILVCTTNAMAGRCAGIDPPGVVFCDDFDRYCASPPEWPGACADGTPPYYGLPDGFHQVWQQLDGTCSPNQKWLLTGDNDRNSKVDGYSVACFNGSGSTQRLVSHGQDMTDEILANTRNTEGYGAVNGSGTILSSRDGGYVDPGNYDLMPDTLKGLFYVWTGANTLEAYPYFVHYVELHMNDDRVPVDFTRVDCYPEAQGPHHIVPATDDNPDPGTPWHHASFAFGMLAYLDTAPCSDHGAEDRRPQLYRAVVYDGVSWTQLKWNGGGPFDLPNGNEDFRLADVWNFCHVYIGTDYIEIRLKNNQSTSRYPGQIPNPYFVARVPRQYTGPFNRISLGPPKGLDTTTPTCAPMWEPGVGYIDRCLGGANHYQTCTSSADCPPSVADECLENPETVNHPYMDELVLYDGVFVPSGAEGACCKPNATCEVLEEETCEDPPINGRYMGDGTVCEGAEAVTCCHTPWADADGDTDVDQVDFAIFQACFSGSEEHEAGCGCFNRDGPTDIDIDGDDFVEFEECWSGPKVPWSATGNCPGTW